MLRPKCNSEKKIVQCCAPEMLNMNENRTITVEDDLEKASMIANVNVRISISFVIYRFIRVATVLSEIYNFYSLMLTAISSVK